ncbi:hypothetical protein DYB34_007490 [Aphanomyces astaci]|uniref:Putative auto-transporter adhesin head GIN domain-containing protein n=1 Tax=Aphanomyces astaci TaxID=112090 RepID=A0A418C520_APHAT|nr:hypothetical protein DYB34_007490 [Aphanomyces astaci]
MSAIVTAPHTFTTSWNTSTPIEGVLLQFPGRVFINQNPSLKAAARVVISSDSQAVLDLFAFNATKAVGDSINAGCNRRYAIDRANQTYLDVSVASAVNAHAAGSLLVLITVQKPVSWVKSTADTVVVSGALVNGPSKFVSITSLGAGNITTTAKYPVTLSNLTLSTTGTGKVQFAATTTFNTTAGVSLVIAGPGSVALQAGRTLNIPNLTTTVTGSGSVFVTTNGTLTAQNIKTYLFGSGNVSYYPARGSTVNNTINLFKSGHVYSGSVLAQNATVAVSGAGGVVVQVNDTLTTSIDGAGSVAYYNKTVNPVHVSKPKGWWVFTSSSAVATTNNTFNVYKSVAEPAKVPLNVTIDLNQTLFSRCFVQRFETAVDTTALSSTISSPQDVASVACVALALLALVVLAIFKGKLRTKGYTALPK